MHARLALELVILASMLPAAAAFGAEPLVCGPGTESRSGAGNPKGVLKEWCVDPKTGLKEGPERELRADGSLLASNINRHGKPYGTGYLYNEKEEILAEATFDENGKPLTPKWTLAGLKVMASSVNEMGAKQETPFHIDVIDLHTLAYEVRLDGATPSEAADRRMREMAPKNPQICQLFRVPGVSIETVWVRVVNEKKEVLSNFSIGRDECVATAEK